MLYIIYIIKYIFNDTIYYRGKLFAKESIKNVHAESS